ncbi:hypothetical protein [Parafrankia sp. FMc2]|uniref:hypothetical protein n=1 Tax=Parafrankia sp. FMc2 TaxID=3233196 RepID=UPI0034D5692A
MLPLFGHPPGLAAVYAWGPAAGLDVGVDAHVDVLAAAAAATTAALALLARARTRPTDRQGGSPRRGRSPGGRRRRGRPGTRRRADVPVTSAAAGRGRGRDTAGSRLAVKLYPAPLLPAAARRRPVVLDVAAAVIGLSYLPHVAVVGTDVLGFLPQYLSVEGYGEGHRFLPLGLVGLTGTATKTAAALMIAAAALAVWRTDPTRIPVERATLRLVGTALGRSARMPMWRGPPSRSSSLCKGDQHLLVLTLQPSMVQPPSRTDARTRRRSTANGGSCSLAAVCSISRSTDP